MKRTIAAAVISLAFFAYPDTKVTTIKINDEGRVKAESVALEEDTNLVSTVVETLANSTNLADMAAFRTFARFQRGDDTYRIDPNGISLSYFTEEGGSSTDPETGAFHFSVERYWTDESNSLVASITDSTFDNPEATATWRLYLSGELSGEAVASASARLIDFGNGASAVYNPVETVVYSDQFHSATNAIWKQMKSISPKYTIRPQVRPDGRISYIIFSDAQ